MSRECGEQLMGDSGNSGKDVKGCQVLSRCQWTSQSSKMDAQYTNRLKTKANA